MTSIFLSCFFANLIFFFSGSIFHTKFFKFEKWNFFEKFFYGVILISFIALFLNFFLSLGQLLNTLIISAIITYALLIVKIKISKEDCKFLLFISLISFFYLALSNSYRPDAGIYHLPYVSILNNEKIIFGLHNLHQRFATISIVQYLSAFLNSFYLGENGIAIPSSIIASFVIVFFVHNIYHSIVLKLFDINILYFFIFFIYIVFKMNRYGEFGNDAPGHFLFFFATSYFLINFKNKDKFNEILILSVFVFLNKISLIVVFLIPLLHFFKNKIKFLELKNLKIFFSISFVVLWLAKNLIVSGCLLYPIKNTCINELEWSNISKTHNFSINIESFAKSHSLQDNNNKYLAPKEYNSKFNWFKTWLNTHFKKTILDKILIFSLISCIFVFISGYGLNNKLKFKSNNDDNIKIFFLLFISFIGSTLWFLKGPTYRFGYSYLIILLSSIIVYFSIKYFLKKKNINFRFLKVILICLVLILLGKNAFRIVTKYDYKYYNYPWTKIYSMDSSNYLTKNFPKVQQKEILYYSVSKFSDQNCNYSRSICVPEHEVSKKLKFKNFFSYKMYISK